MPKKQVTRFKHGKGSMLFANGDFYNGDWSKDQMQGTGGIYYSIDNYFYKGSFEEGDVTGYGVFFYCNSQDFYMGEVQKGEFHGKGLYFRQLNDMWELNEYSEGKLLKNIKSGEGRPQSLEIAKEI